MQHDLQILLATVEDEFKAFTDVRVWATAKVIAQRAFDLPEIDSENPPELPEKGVFVRTHRKEFFFPVSWIRDKHFELISKQVDQIREHIQS